MAAIKAGQFGDIVRDKRVLPGGVLLPAGGQAGSAGLRHRPAGRQGMGDRRGAAVGDRQIQQADRRRSRPRRSGWASPMPAAKAELGAKTRSKKQKELTLPELREAWDAQLTDGERDALAAVYRREVAGRPGGDGRPKRWPSPSPIAQRKAVGVPRAGIEAGGPAARAGQRHAGAGRGRAAASGRHHRARSTAG